MKNAIFALLCLFSSFAAADSACDAYNDPNNKEIQKIVMGEKYEGAKTPDGMAVCVRKSLAVLIGATPASQDCSAFAGAMQEPTSVRLESGEVKCVELADFESMMAFKHLTAE